MSGHSKWATIKRAKASNDAKRGAIFTKISNIITVAAREKGGDPETNFSLRMAIEKGKQANMPKDNIEKAIKRGTGEITGGQIENLIYEGIGPGNIQYVVRVLTDNKNRSASNIRHAFTKFGGSLGATMWNFSQKGVIRINKESLEERKINFDDFELKLIDLGAEDIENEEEGVTIYTNVENLINLKKKLEEENIKTESAEIEYIAKEKIKLTQDLLEKQEKFEDFLDDLEDVSDFYSNAA